jgi:hypothetical protein
MASSNLANVCAWVIKKLTTTQYYEIWEKTEILFLLFNWEKVVIFLFCFMVFIHLVSFDLEYSDSTKKEFECYVFLRFVS